MSSNQQSPNFKGTISNRISNIKSNPTLPNNSNSELNLPSNSINPSIETDLHNPRWANVKGPANFWSRFRYIYKEELAEFLATSFIILFGTSVECQTTLHYNSIKQHPYSFGDYTSCRLAWATGVTIAIWISGHISGGHCNPTVTIALWLFRGFPSKKVFSYILSQILGATFATFIVYSNYQYSIGLFEGQGLPSSIRTVTGSHATAPLFFTFPQPWLPSSSAFLSEFIASAALICAVFALSDNNNTLAKGSMGYSMFIVLIGIGSSMGVNTGYALNGARDTGPRIALWILGYGNEIWYHDKGYWFYAPWIGAITGGCCGGLIYDLLIYTGKDSFINRPIGGRRNVPIDSINENSYTDEEQQQQP